MKTHLSLILLLIGQTLFYSYLIPHDRENICDNNFKKAKDLADKNTSNHLALDSALIMVNGCMHCDSIKTAVVDLKIRLLITLGKFKEGSEFIDSLQTSDFPYPYKKDLMHDNFTALNFAANRDTINRDKVYKKMGDYLISYIKNNHLKSKEFQEAFTDLDALPKSFADSLSLNQQIDSLKIKYPDEKRFLDFFKN